MSHDIITAQTIKCSADPQKYKPMNSICFGYPQNFKPSKEGIHTVLQTCTCAGTVDGSVRPTSPISITSS